MYGSASIPRIRLQCTRPGKVSPPSSASLPVIRAPGGAVLRLVAEAHGVVTQAPAREAPSKGRIEPGPAGRAGELRAARGHDPQLGKDAAEGKGGQVGVDDARDRARSGRACRHRYGVNLFWVVCLL